MGKNDGGIDGARNGHGFRLKPVLVILLRPQKKTLFGTFLCLVVLSSSFKFQLKLILNFN